MPDRENHLTSKPWIPAELTNTVRRDATSTPWILGKQDHQGQRMHPHHACAPKDIPLCNVRLVYLPSLAFLGFHLPIPKTSSPTDTHLPLPLRLEVPEVLKPWQPPQGHHFGEVLRTETCQGKPCARSWPNTQQGRAAQGS